MNEFVDNLEQVFSLFGPVHSRKMFGGHGIFHEGLMFGLVADDILYLKADPASEDAFREQGSHPFEYMKNGKAVKMSYFLAPETIYEDPEEARRWAQRAYAAALRNR